MADNIVTAATISLSGDRGASVSGSNESLSVLKDIRNSLRDLTMATQKETKLQQSGLLGSDFTSGGVIGKLLSKVGGTATSFLTAGYAGQQLFEDSAAAGGFPLQGDLGLKGSPLYEKAFVGDEEVVLDIDRKTGEILEVLTIQEAKQKGILDDLGNLEDKYKTNLSIFDKATENLEKYRDSVELTAENYANIQTNTEAERKLQLEIGKLLIKKRDMLADEVGEEGSRIRLATGSGISLGAGTGISGSPGFTTVGAAATTSAIFGQFIQTESLMASRIYETDISESPISIVRLKTNTQDLIQ